MDLYQRIDTIKKTLAPHVSLDVSEYCILPYLEELYIYSYTEAIDDTPTRYKKEMSGETLQQQVDQILQLRYPVMYHLFQRIHEEMRKTSPNTIPDSVLPIFSKLFANDDTFVVYRSVLSQNRERRYSGLIDQLASKWINFLNPRVEETTPQSNSEDEDSDYVDDEDDTGDDDENDDDENEDNEEENNDDENDDDPREEETENEDDEEEDTREQQLSSEIRNFILQDAPLSLRQELAHEMEFIEDEMVNPYHHHEEHYMFFINPTGRHFKVYKTVYFDNGNSKYSSMTFSLTAITSSDHYLFKWKEMYDRHLSSRRSFESFTDGVTDIKVSITTDLAALLQIDPTQSYLFNTILTLFYNYLINHQLVYLTKEEQQQNFKPHDKLFAKDRQPLPFFSIAKVQVYQNEPVRKLFHLIDSDEENLFGRRRQQVSARITSYEEEDHTPVRSSSRFSMIEIQMMLHFLCKVGKSA